MRLVDAFIRYMRLRVYKGYIEYAFGYPVRFSMRLRVWLRII